jgi:hypothetical protein
MDRDKTLVVSQKSKQNKSPDSSGRHREILSYIL